MRFNHRAVFIVISFVVISASSVSIALADSWPQWGGRSRNFSVTSDKLADTWPMEGPPKLWSRSLGDGYSSMVGESECVYTMYRPDRTASEEIVVAINAKSGKTVWESRFESVLTPPVDSMGQGPNSTPVLVGDRLYAVGTNALVRCLDKRTGKLVWSRDLYAEFASPHFGGYGYSCSPVAYKDTIIIPLGYRPKSGDGGSDGRDRSVVALKLDDGKLAWKSDDYVVWQSSPTVITHGGKDQLVLLMTNAIAAIDPNSGKQLWRLSHDEGAFHTTTPFWNGRDLLVFAPDGSSGEGRAIKLAIENGMTVPRLAWANRKLNCSIYIGANIGDGLFVPGDSRLCGFDLRDGKRAWVERGFDAASCVQADEKLFILDRNGQLTLAMPSIKGLNIRAQCQVSERDSLTSPILVGRTLFIRDRKNIMAFDVGAPTAE